MPCSGSVTDPAGQEVHVALLTPADADERLDGAALAAHVRWLADAGVDGVLVAGTTGEGPLLHDDDVTAAVAAAADAAEGRLQVVAHVGRPATRATVRLARAAAEAGATAASAVVPYYFPLDDDQLLRHFAAVAEAVAPLPLIAYAIPERTRNDISPVLLDRLAGAGVAGIKDSTKSLERHLEYVDVARRHPGLRVYMGSDALALEALRAGATGLMSAVANALPESVVSLRDAAAEERWPAAEAVQQEILAFRADVARERALVGLKQHVARRLGEVGGIYPATVTAPLG
jgi:dihydrodipicolinate synthase/N-acetylneuraminate lyase